MNEGLKSTIWHWASSVRGQRRNILSASGSNQIGLTSSAMERNGLSIRDTQKRRGPQIGGMSSRRAGSKGTRSRRSQKIESFVSSASKRPRSDLALPPMGLALDFMRVLWALDHGLQSGSKRMNARLGVTGPQRLVVRMIGKLPGISAGQLARALHVHPSTLTGVLRRLESRRAIERRGAPEDGRRAHFFLTREGERINKWQLGTVESRIRRALVRLSPKEVATACSVLQAVTRELADFQSADARND